VATSGERVIPFIANSEASISKQISRSGLFPVNDDFFSSINHLRGGVIEGAEKEGWHPAGHDALAPPPGILFPQPISSLPGQLQSQVSGGGPTAKNN
jgi:hypothetical protein